MIVRRFNDMLPFIITAILLWLLWLYIDRIFILLFDLSGWLSQTIWGGQ